MEGVFETRQAMWSEDLLLEMNRSNTKVMLKSLIPADTYPEDLGRCQPSSTTPRNNQANKEYNVNKRGGDIMLAWEDSALWLIQSYWIVRLTFSAVVAMLLGGVILSNYQEIK